MPDAAKRQESVGRDYFYDTVRRALAEHGDPAHVPMHKGTGCTYCQGAMAALDALRAENERLEQALAQACSNLATVRPDERGGTTLGEDAVSWREALLAGRPSPW